MMFVFCAIILGLASSSLGMPGAILSEYQDSLGQYSFGYSSPVSARSEVRSVDGKTRGAFSFVDDSGVIQTARYTADSEGGFRIEASHLPEAPQPVQETPEVVAARKEHFEAIAEAERLKKVQQTVEIQNSENLMAKSSGEEQMGTDLIMKDDKPMMMAEEKQEGLKEENEKDELLTRMKEHEHMEKSENVQAGASKLNRMELQPMGQSSGAPITTIPQGFSATGGFIGPANLRGTSSFAIISSPYIQYTAIYPYGHYPFA